MKPTTTPNWEEEFDKINLCGCTRICYGHDKLKKQLIDFISQTILSAEEAKVRECIEKMKEVENDNCGDDHCHCLRYAIDLLENPGASRFLSASRMKDQATKTLSNTKTE